ncbi:hypothetical protein [Nocardioides sp. YIM 152588]|uniref:hypothetical protein n=1 Tax=Nocardioides sp. YIM 152588 TaxID=3158259 RepID=UPI0032E3AC76
MHRTPRRRLAAAVSAALLSLGLAAGVVATAPVATASEQTGTGADAPADRSDVGRLATELRRDQARSPRSAAYLRRQLRGNAAYAIAAGTTDFIVILDDEEFTFEDFREVLVLSYARTARLRAYIRATAVVDGHFTFTVLTDQACVSEDPETTEITVRRGPCDGDDVATSTSPLKDLVGLVDAALAPALRGWVLGAYFEHMSLPRLLGGADASIAFVPGSVTDRNEDGIDDDGRFELTRNGATYCLQAPLTKGESARLAAKPCADLRPRSSAWLGRAGELAFGAYDVVDSIRNLSRNTSTKISRLGPAEIDAVRRTMDPGYRLTRSGPLRFRVWERSRTCSVRVTFRADKVGARARIGQVRCDA